MGISVMGFGGDIELRLNEQTRGTAATNRGETALSAEVGKMPAPLGYARIVIEGLKGLANLVRSAGKEKTASNRSTGRIARTRA